MSKPLRLAYLTSYYARPSDTFIRDEVNRLREQGALVHTFSIRRPQNASEADADILEHQANTEYILETSTWRLAWVALCTALSRPKLFFQATRLALQTHVPGVRGFCLQAVYLLEAVYLAVRIRQLEIAHLHNHIGENSATVAMLAGCLAEIPYSLTIHGPGIFYAPQRWALGTKLDRAAWTACISHFCRSQCMLHSQPSTWPRLHVVRCAVGESFLNAPVRHESPSRESDVAVYDSQSRATRPLILCVGRLCVEKGQRLLVDAAAELASEGLQFQLQLVGDGPEREPLQQRIENCGLSGTVEIVGWQSSDRIGQLLLEAQVFVLPSFAEGLPIVLMEAMALECPVISTTVAAIGELIEHKKNGWLLPPGQLEPLVEAIREAITMPPQELAAMGRHGRECVKRQHNPQQQAEKLMQLFSS